VPHCALSANAAYVNFSKAKIALKPTQIYQVQHYTKEVTIVTNGSNPEVW